MCNHKNTTPLMIIGQIIFGLLIMLVATLINGIWRTIGLLIFIFKPKPKYEDVWLQVKGGKPRLVTERHEVLVELGLAGIRGSRAGKKWRDSLGK